MSWQRITVAVVSLVAIAAGAAVWLRRPSETAVSRGAELARELGCFACHGPGAGGGVRNPGARDREVPAWDGGTAMMYIESEAEIREWILYGRPKRLQKRSSTGHGLIEMPAYQGRVDGAELDDLVAYFQAVSAYTESPVSSPVREGRRIASRLGCFGCHGPSGRLAMPNPGSFKGMIPAWDGADFDQLVHDDDELRGWILDGIIPRLAENPVARVFLERQVIAMPAYRDYLEDGELEALLAYIHSVRTGTTEGDTDD